jgi:hypothetical protein
VYLECEKREALRLKVELFGDIHEYAISLLAIYNNVKNDKDLLKLYNDYDNNVYLVCEKEVRDAAIEFLEQFGQIIAIETVEVVQPMGLDYEYSNDIDTEFLPVEEI